MRESRDSIYAAPRLVTGIADCGFDHTMEVPGYGIQQGIVDLRRGVARYLGNVDFQNKRVLEMGTGDGFLCFYMESKGADVVAYDLSQNEQWDIVPHAASDYDAHVREQRETAKRLNNAFWLSHRAYRSKAQMVHGTVYQVPREIGMVDIAIFGGILPQVRDPFLALQNALRLTRQTVIITQTFYYAPDLILELLRAPPKVRTLCKSLYDLPAVILERMQVPVRLRDRFRPPLMEFVPKPNRPTHEDKWWRMSPEIVRRMIAVLGFGKSRVSYHCYRHGKGDIIASTIVGHRTVEQYTY